MRERGRKGVRGVRWRCREFFFFVLFLLVQLKGEGKFLRLFEMLG